MKRIYVFGLILLSFFFATFTGCMFEDVNDENPYYDEKIYWKGSIEEDFASDSVIVILSNETSLNSLHNLNKLL